MKKAITIILLEIITLMLIIGVVLSFGSNAVCTKGASSKVIIGKAGWYSRFDRTDSWVHEFNADGSRFNEDAFTCSTRDREFGRYYKVTNLKNGKSVIVLKNDFGPAEKYKGRRLNRVIDLSKAAFSKIADLKQGVILVKVEASFNPIKE
jgi:rare lipoprotein A